MSTLNSEKDSACIKIGIYKSEIYWQWKRIY